LYLFTGNTGCTLDPETILLYLHSFSGLHCLHLKQ